MWPPFGADIAFELYLQTTGPSFQSRATLPVQAAAIHSHLDWSELRMEQMWIRVRYLGRAMPLARLWCDDAVQQLTGSEEYVPLHEFVRRLTPMALALEDYWTMCAEALEKSKEDKKMNLLNRVPKNI